MKLAQLSFLLPFLVVIVACQPVTDPERSAVSDTAPAPRLTISGLYDGQLLEQDRVTIQYSLAPEVEGNIAVLYIDNGDPQPLPGLAGEYEVTRMEPGVHTLKIKEMTADFIATGYFDQINFIVQ
ncbi:hypothetical protein JYT96_00230 [Gammaproteobacteria bacterium AH-315-C21]|nr:hypothetical protein [Gammaproteobacteria bacterium]MBN4078412.1 hypothetical protein [Gammaproteobacteria bacterium AH-315-C21]PCH64787.1 MAG: hypothetical protein COC09_00910 [Gammaproteobacteria bacterium]